jgi:F0F1-type ATP synthase membrane subunit c/vacuolar-type H+-ATPase subunit K
LTLAFGSILGFIAGGFASFSVSAVEEAVAASSSMDAVEVQPAASGKTRKQIRKKGKTN